MIEGRVTIEWLFDEIRACLGLLISKTKVTIGLTGILYKAYSDLDLQKKRASDLYTDLIPKITL